MVGQTISHHEVLEKLGEGGMGVVYKARDTHLDRLVALKILPPHKVSDPERKRRFVQEAKAASALNHPNIVTIYDIDQAAGVHFIAMEYVAGKTLDQLIGRKGMKLSDALHYAVQITDALAKAHSAGIVHRDLKPSNIMVTGDGQVKILDFGLAKLMEVETESGEDMPTATMGLTETPHTEEGTIVGTVAYMSPEQAEGKKVDARSDIFSFGAVFYEMLTGHRAFRGKSKVSTLAAILHQEPDPPSATNVTLPADTERILNRCLRKDPQRRWQTMQDLKIALEDLKEESESGRLAAATVPRARRTARWLFAGAGVVAISVLLAGVIWRSSRSEPAALDLKAERFTFDPGITGNPAISPDGKLAAYASDRSGEGNLDIYVQHIHGGQASRLTRHEADDYQPAFSPDGSQIAFRSERDGGGIYVVDTLGGPERRLVAGGRAPSFSPDGSTIAYVQTAASGLPIHNKIFLVPSQGGQPRAFQPGFGVVPPFFSSARTPMLDVGSPPLIWSADGKHLLFAGVDAGKPPVFDWWVAALDGGPPVATGSVRSLATPLPAQSPLAWFGKHVYFCRGSLVEGIHLFRAPIALGGWRISGPAQRLTSGGGVHSAAAIASDGRVLFSIMNPGVDFFSLPLDTKTGTVSGQPTAVTADAAIKGGASISRDRPILAYIAYASWEARRIEIRVRNLVGGSETAYASSAILSNPQISPDGSVIGYSDEIDGKSYAGPADSLPGRQICEGCRILGFFSDSRALVLYGTNQLMRQDLATGAQTPVLTIGSGALHGVTRGVQCAARLSYDDRWVAFTVVAPSGDVHMYVAPVRDTPAPEEEWVRIVADRSLAVSPVWSSDGRLLYYLSDRDGHTCVWAQRLDPATKRPLGAPFSVYHLHRPETSAAGWGHMMFLVGARDKLILPIWKMTSNLWMTKLDTK